MLQNKKIIVLDDDPTGIQAIHDLIVYTRFDKETLIKAFKSEYQLVFLSTNSRSLTEKETIDLHQEILNNLFIAKDKTGIDFELISRGDSTLRGHYPVETEEIVKAYKKRNIEVDGEIICPFLEGIRKTVDDIHYVLKDNTWIKCGESEFAKDETFAYKSSDLKDYVEEKYGEKKNFLSIRPEQSIEEIIKSLENVVHGTKIIVNATKQADINRFVKALKQVKDKRFTYRTAANFVKAYAEILDKELLKMEDIMIDSNCGSLIFAGSHVSKTTEQIQNLINNVDFEVLVANKNDNSIADKMNSLLSAGKNVLVETPRELIRLSDDLYQRLMDSRQMSKDFTSILKNLKESPKIIISKGGITSYDVLSNGLECSEYYVLGQILSAVPVCKLLNGPNAGLNVVVFPGNVGDKYSLLNLFK